MEERIFTVLRAFGIEGEYVTPRNAQAVLSQYSNEELAAHVEAGNLLITEA
jgi:hypothetical protein